MRNISYSLVARLLCLLLASFIIMLLCIGCSNYKTSEERKVKEMLTEKWSRGFSDTTEPVMILHKTDFKSTEPVKEIAYQLLNDTSNRWNYGEQCILLYNYQEEWYITNIGPLTSDAVLYDLLPYTEEELSWCVTTFKEDVPQFLFPGSYRLIKELYPYDRNADQVSIILFSDFSVE